MSPVSTITKKILEIDKDIDGLGTKDLLKLTMMSQIHARMIMTTGDGESIEGLGNAIKRCLEETPAFIKNVVQEEGLSLAETLTDEYISDNNSLFKSILSPKVVDHLKLLHQDIESSTNPQPGSMSYSPSSHISSLLLLVHILYEIGPIDSALNAALDTQEELLKVLNRDIVPSPDIIEIAMSSTSLLDIMLKCVCDLHRVMAHDRFGNRGHVTGDILVKTVMGSEYWKDIIEAGRSTGRFSDTGYDNLLDALAALGVNNMPQDAVDHPGKTDLHIDKISKILNISNERVRKTLAAECSCSRCTTLREVNKTESI